MIYTIEIIEPGAVQLLKELVKLHLIKFVSTTTHPNVAVDDETAIPKRVANEILTGLKAVQKYAKGEIELQDAYDLLRELEEEAANS